MARPSQQELTALASGIPARDIRSLSCTNDPDDNIAFVTIHRIWRAGTSALT